MEVAQNKFPYPDFLPPIELVTYITNLPAPTLSKEYKWSEKIEDFLKIWYMIFLKHLKMTYFCFSSFLKNISLYLVWKRMEENDLHLNKCWIIHLFNYQHKGM